MTRPKVFRRSQTYSNRLRVPGGGRTCQNVGHNPRRTVIRGHLLTTVLVIDQFSPVQTNWCSSVA